MNDDLVKLKEIEKTITQAFIDVNIMLTKYIIDEPDLFCKLYPELDPGAVCFAVLKLTKENPLMVFYLMEKILRYKSENN